MAIKTSCPKCGKSISAPDSYLHKKVKCSHCATKFTVYTPEELMQQQQEAAQKAEIVSIKPKAAAPAQSNKAAHSDQQTRLGKTPTVKSRRRPPAGAALPLDPKILIIVGALLLVMAALLVYLVIQVGSVSDELTRTNEEITNLKSEIRKLDSRLTAPARQPEPPVVQQPQPAFEREPEPQKEPQQEEQTEPEPEPEPEQPDNE